MAPRHQATVCCRAELSPTPVAVDTQGPTGRHSTHEVVALCDDDQLREIEDSFGPQARLVSINSPRVSNHLLRR